MAKTNPLDDDIGRVAKKFAMLHRLWVISGLFPITSNLNPNVDLLSAGRWNSPEAKRDAVLTELFRIAPQPLHKEMVKYKTFGSVVRDQSLFIRFLYANHIKLVYQRPESGEV